MASGHYILNARNCGDLWKSEWQNYTKMNAIFSILLLKGPGKVALRTEKFLEKSLNLLGNFSGNHGYSDAASHAIA